MVSAGLEPATAGLEIPCSILLSYETEGFVSLIFFIKKYLFLYINLCILSDLSAFCKTSSKNSSEAYSKKSEYRTYSKYFLAFSLPVRYLSPS